MEIAPVNNTTLTLREGAVKSNVNPPPTGPRPGPPRSQVAPPRQRQFVIWRRGGSRPRVRHQNLNDALAEVTRLRTANPDATYDVLELVPLSGMGGRR